MTQNDSLPVRVRPEIAALAAYRQGRPAEADAFKLSSNENPFDPLPEVLDAVQAAAAINRYPDASATRLRERLAAEYGVTSAQVHVGAGSVSLLSQLIGAAAGPGDEVLYAWRSFEAYPSLVTVSGATSVRVPVTADGRHNLAAMREAITERTRVILVCSPNNPTGPVVTQAAFDDFVAGVPRDVLVVLDEAYAEFVTDPDAVRAETVIAAATPNVVVLRTFSKAYGLAGLRVGYGIGHPRIWDAARSASIPLSVTAHAEAAALASLDARDALMARVSELVQRRTRLLEGLRDAGWIVPEAQGNFVWLATGAQTLAVAEAFHDGGIVVRPFAEEGVRISVGEHESVEKVLRIARSVVEDLPQGHPARR